MGTTVTRLSSNGVYFTNGYLDEVTYNSNKLTLSAIYSAEFDEVTGTDYSKEGLVLYLDAGKTSSYSGTGNTWYDLSDNKYTATLVNNPTYNNNAIYFNRNNNTSGIINNFDLSDTNAVTISIWVKFNSLPTVSGYTGDYTRVLCELSTNLNTNNAFNISTEYELTGFRFTCGMHGNVGYNVKNISNILPVINTWYNLTVVIDQSLPASNQINFYLNGASSGIVIGTTSNNNQTYNAQNTNNFIKAPLYIASRSSNTFISDAYISTLQIYKRALSSTEVLQNYNGLKGRFDGTAVQPNGIAKKETNDGKVLVTGYFDEVSGIDYVKNGLVMNLDAAISQSYSGAGNNWYDISYNGNNGTLVNGPTFNNAYEGGIVFDNSNDYVNCGTSPSLSFGNSFTLDIWFNAISLSTSNFARLFYKIAASDGFSLIFQSSNGVQLLINNSNVFNLTNVFTLGVNVNLTVTVDKNVAIVYRNGVFVGSSSSIPNMVISNANLLIGNRPALDRGFDGTIYNAKIYNRPLTSSEILQNFNSIRGRFGI